MSEVSDERLRELREYYLQHGHSSAAVEMSNLIRELQSLRARALRDEAWRREAETLLTVNRGVIDEAIWSYREQAKRSNYGSDEWKRFHALADAAIVTRGKLDAFLQEKPTSALAQGE